MDRISAANYTTVGGLREFQDLNLGTGAQGTGLNALWHNGVQESILGPVDAVGLTPSDSDNTQLLQAMQTIGSSFTMAISGAATHNLTPLQCGLIEVNATAGNVVINAPAPNAISGVADLTMKYRFLRTDTSGNSATVQTPSGDLLVIGSAPAASIILPVTSMTTIESDGTNWIVSGPYASAASVSAETTRAEAAEASIASAAYLVNRQAAFTTNSSFTVPAIVTTLFVDATAGGAGGDNTYPGGAGQWVKSYELSVAPGHALSISIGGGGTAGIYSGASKGAGGNTVITDTTTSTTLLTLTGATGGGGQSVGYPAGSQASGGGTLPGATNPFGGGGPAGGTGGGTAGGNAYGSGCGGGQGQTANGGAGAPGYVQFRW